MKHLKEYNDLSDWTKETFETESRIAFRLEILKSHGSTDSEVYDRTKDLIKKLLDENGIVFKEMRCVDSPTKVDSKNAYVLEIEGHWTIKDIVNLAPDRPDNCRAMWHLSIHNWHYAEAGTMIVCPAYWDIGKIGLIINKDDQIFKYWK